MTSFSAWDVAGAVVWTPLAVMLWHRWFSVDFDEVQTVVGFFTSLIFLLFAVYSLARICGVRA